MSALATSPEPTGRFVGAVLAIATLSVLPMIRYGAIARIE